MLVRGWQSAEEGLKALAKFAANWPALADNAYMVPPKLGLLVRGNHISEAKELAEHLIKKGVTRGDTSGLRGVAAALRDDSAKRQADLAALAVKAAEACYEADPENVPTLLNLLETHAFAGDQAKVNEFGPKSVAAAKAAVSGEHDALGTMNVAAAYFAAGDKEQAKTTAEKAIKMLDAKNLGLKQYVERQAKRYGVGTQQP
jgi:tetratricopeptide (TPR) repeat protein